MPFHKNITAANNHVIGYVQSSDPGAIGAGKTWIDTTLGAGNWELKIRNTTDTGWESIISGGGGVSTMEALTDGPGAGGYVGKGGFLVAVNGTADGFEFIDDATFALAAELGSYLPLDGSDTMAGPIQFENDTEGIEFNDGAGVYFNGVALDISRGAIVVGGNAPDMGGYPDVILDAASLQFGANGTGTSTLALWEDTAADFVNIITFYDGGLLEFGYGSSTLALLGDGDYPTFNGDELAKNTETFHLAVDGEINSIALKATPVAADLIVIEDSADSYSKKKVTLTNIASSVAYDAEAIPRMQIGSGQAYISVASGIAMDVAPLPSTGGVNARICARDFIQFIRGGATNLEYKLVLLTWADLGGGTPSMSYSSDPTSPLDLDTVDLLSNIGTQVLRVYVKDGGDEVYTEVALILQNNLGY